MKQEPEIDMTICPRCGALEPDFDGMGMIAHTKPAYANGCGYCTHPMFTGGVCTICGQRDPEEPN